MELELEPGTFREPTDPRRPRGSVFFSPTTAAWSKTTRLSADEGEAESYSPPIERRTLPPIQWRAVLAALAIAVLIVFLARLLLAPIPGLIATILGIGLAGYLAGKWADSAGVYHGAVLGACWIGLEVIGLAPGATYSEDVLTDTVVVIALDLVTLIAASLGGWIARRDPSSSSGTGRAR